MTKPTIFFSHSARDAEALIRLKERFLKLTNGTLDVFLSSDGQSIGCGENWLAVVERALDGASLMFTFVTPNSVGSSWLYFESGAAYGRKIKVVPLGLFGVNVDDLPPALRILQGFNVTSYHSLNNIIATVNRLFDHDHELGFVEADYTALQTAGPLGAMRVFGQYHAALEEIYVCRSYDQTSANREWLNTAREALGGDVVRDGDSFVIPGARFSFEAGSVEATIDPFAASSVFPVLEAVCVAGGPRAAEASAPEARLYFARSVAGETDAHRVLARLQGTGVVPVRTAQGIANWWPRFAYRSLEFALVRDSRQQLELQIGFRSGGYDVVDWATFLDLLFRNRVLWYAG